MSKPRYSPGEPVDLRYGDGYDTVYLHGHVPPDEAARLAEDFVWDARKEDAGSWETTLRAAYALPGEPKPGTSQFRCDRCGAECETEPKQSDDMWYTDYPAACPSCGADCAEDIPRPRYGEARHTYARWGMPDEDGVHPFLDGVVPGRGAFPVTVAFDLGALERERARRAAVAAAVATRTAEVLARYPTATIETSRVYGPDEVGVVFRLPGMAGVLHADRGWPVTISVNQDDLACFEAVYSSRATMTLEQFLGRGAP